MAYETLNHLFLKSDDLVKEESDLVFWEEGRVSKVALKSDLLIINTGKIDSLAWELNELVVLNIKDKNTVKSLRIEFNFDKKAFEWYFYKNFGKIKKIDIVER